MGAEEQIARLKEERGILRSRLADAVGTLTSAVHVLADVAISGKTLAQRPDERERFQQCAEALAELQALRRRLLGDGR